MLDFLFSLIYTITLYSIPIIIYRFAVVKAPVAKKKAKKITIIYGFCAFLVNLLILYCIYTILDEPFPSSANVTAAFIYSTVNYYLLIKGKEKNKYPDESANSNEHNYKYINGILLTDPAAIEESAPEPHSKLPAAMEHKTKIYCRKCGSELSVEAQYCHKCGEKIIS